VIVGLAEKFDATCFGKLLESLEQIFVKHFALFQEYAGQAEGYFDFFSFISISVDDVEQDIVRGKIAFLACSLKNPSVHCIVKVVVEKFFFLDMFENLIIPVEILLYSMRLMNLKNQYDVCQRSCPLDCYYGCVLYFWLAVRVEKGEGLSFPCCSFF
jgi:hypothetical protein